MINLLGWLGNIFFIMGALFLAYKRKIGFLINTFGITCYLFMGGLLKMNSLIGCEIIFICISIWSYLKWKDDESYIEIKYDKK